MGMPEWLEDSCDEIDASVFSSDSLHDIEAIERFQWYLGRWSREATNIKKSLEENINSSE